MTKVIYFDMDGTVADLYGSDNWLENLREERVGAFVNLAPMVNMEELRKVCMELMAQGWRFGIITWLPMQAESTKRSAPLRRRLGKRSRCLGLQSSMLKAMEYLSSTHQSREQGAWFWLMTTTKSARHGTQQYREQALMLRAT